MGNYIAENGVGEEKLLYGTAQNNYKKVLLDGGKRAIDNYFAPQDSR